MSQKLVHNWKWPKRISHFVVLYFNNCCIHGFRYLVKSMLLLFERLLWLILLVVSIYFCIISCLSSVNRFNNKSTHIGMERNWYSWNTSLPSLTVCPMQRLNETKFSEYCRIHKIVLEAKNEFRHFLENLANSTYTNFQNIPEYDSIDETLKLLDIKPERYMELIYNLSIDGTYQTEELNRTRCTDGTIDIRVRQILTEFGLCFVCNSYLGAEQTSSFLIFGKYPKPNKILTGRPFVDVKYGRFFERDVGLSLIGFLTKAIDTYVHSPYEVMRVDSNYGYTELGSAYELEIEHVTAEPNFETSASVSQRKCRYFHESNLTHYPFYTKNTCMQECRLNLAYKICKCIPHFYPNRIAKPKPVCTYKQLKSCFPRHSSYFLKFYEVNGTHEKPPVCYCDQSCLDSIVRLKKAEPMKGALRLLNSVGSSVLIKYWPRNLFKRQVIFSFTDLLVSIGGTAGLYLGFSVLGLVELIYFFTLRLLWQILGYKI